MTVKLISELFMIVLCIFTSPFNQDESKTEEIRIDLIGKRGYVDTLIVKRIGEGFAVYDEMNGKLVKGAIIQPVKDKKYTYLCKDLTPNQSLTNSEDGNELVDLPKSIINFETLKLEKKKKETLRSVVISGIF